MGIGINYGFSDPDKGTSLKSSKGTLNSGSDDNFVQIDVPGNGSCFWSVAYAYLTLAEDDNDFHKRYKCLFEDKGIEHSKSFRGQIFNKVLTSKEIIGFDEALVGKFRDKVARYIPSDQNLKGFVGTENICHVFEDLPAQEKIICEKLKENNKFHFKVNNLKDINDELIGTVEHSKAAEIISEAYVKCVRDNQFWGSSTEIRAMEQILNLRIGVFKNESLFYPTGPIDGNSSAKIQLYHVDRDTHYKFGLKQSIIDRNTPKQSSPLKNITNSPPKQSGTSHSKSPGKENRLQSSSSKKRMSSTINEGAVKVRRRLDLDENISANLVLDDKGEKEQPESQRSEQENSSTSMNDADANVVLVSQKSSSLQSFSSPIKRGNPATGENDTTPQKVRRVNQSDDDSIVGESKIVIDKLLVFVENFVKNFNNTLKRCYDEIKGKEEKNQLCCHNSLI